MHSLHNFSLVKDKPINQLIKLKTALKLIAKKDQITHRTTSYWANHWTGWVNVFSPEPCKAFFSNRGFCSNPDFCAITQIFTPAQRLLIQNRGLCSKIEVFALEPRFLLQNQGFCSRTEVFAPEQKFLLENRGFCSRIKVLASEQRFLLHNRGFCSGTEVSASALRFFGASDSDQELVPLD